MRVALDLQRTTATGEVQALHIIYNYRLNNFGTDFAPGQREMHELVMRGYRENGWQVTAVEATENGRATAFTNNLEVDIMSPPTTAARATLTG